MHKSEHDVPLAGLVVVGIGRAKPGDLFVSGTRLYRHTEGTSPLRMIVRQPAVTSYAAPAGQDLSKEFAPQFDT